MARRVVGSKLLRSIFSPCRLLVIVVLESPKDFEESATQCGPKGDVGRRFLMSSDAVNPRGSRWLALPPRGSGSCGVTPARVQLPPFAPGGSNSCEWACLPPVDRGGTIGNLAVDGDPSWGCLRGV